MTIFKNITIGQHVPGNSLIHRLDPRTKIIATGLLIVLLFLVEGFFRLRFSRFGHCRGDSHLRYSLAVCAARLAPPLACHSHSHCGAAFFMTEGRIIFQIWFIKITWEGGVLRGLMMGTRLILLIVGTSMLTLTTSPIQLTDGIESLLKPGKKNRYPRPRAGHDDDHCAAFHSHPFGRNGKNNESADGQGGCGFSKRRYYAAGEKPDSPCWFHFSSMPSAGRMTWP